MQDNPTSPIVAVTGSVGADLPSVNRWLRDKGWAVLWPGQNVSSRRNQEFVTVAVQNPVLRTMHTTLLESHQASFLDTQLPIAYDVQIPDTSDFAAKFRSPFLVSDVLLGPLLDWWAGVVDAVIDISATEAEDLDAYKKMMPSGDVAHLKKVRAYHNRRRESHLLLYSSVFRVQNVELRNGWWTLLERFVKHELRRR